MLRNMLTITFFDGQCYRQWHDNWDREEDPREPWEDLYEWFVEDTTPFFVLNADVDPYESLGISLDYVLRRDDIRTMQFCLSEVADDT